VFAHDIFTKTRTLIDAKKTSYAGNTASRRDEGSCRLATLHRTASGAASNPLRLGLNRESEQSSHSHDCPYVSQVSESLTPEADSRIGIYLIHHGKQLLGEFAMSTPVPLRSDFDTIGLRMLARRSRDPDQTRRLLALAEIYDGGSRPDAARIGGVGVQIVRDWVVRFNAKGPDGLLTGKAPGAPSILGERQRQALRQVVEDGPIPALHGVVRWRLIDLAQWLFEEFRVSISKPTLSRELRHMGFRKLSARPRHHAQDEEAAAAFKKTFSPSWRRPPQKRLLASR
jgi:transposase